MTTNPLLDSKVREYEHHRKALDLMRTTSKVRDLSQAELRTVISHGEAASTLFAEIDDLKDEQLRSAQVETMSGRVGAAIATSGTGDAPAGPTGVHSLLPSAEQMTQLRSAIESNAGLRFTTRRLARTEQERQHLRAAVTLSLTGGAIGGIDGSLPEPRRLAAAVGLTSHGSTSAGYSGPKFGATTATAATAEGAAKPEAATVTKLDITIKQFARWTTLSRMAWLSQQGILEQFVSWHALAIAKDEDKMLIDAINTAAGSAVAFTAGDQRLQIRKAMSVVEDAVSAACDVVLCHTDDYALIAGFDVTTVDDLGDKPVLFGGALLYPSASVPTGFVLVAALKAAGWFITADPTSVATLNALTTNETTVRTEELVGFDIRLVGACRKVDVVTP